MMSCKKATQLISKRQDVPLSLNEKVGLKLHLMMCSACRAFAKNMDSLGDAMRGFREQDAQVSQGKGAPAPKEQGPKKEEGS